MADFPYNQRRIIVLSLIVVVLALLTLVVLRWGIYRPRIQSLISPTPLVPQYIEVNLQERELELFSELILPPRVPALKEGEQGRENPFVP